MNDCPYDAASFTALDGCVLCRLRDVAGWEARQALEAGDWPSFVAARTLARQLDEAAEP